MKNFLHRYSYTMVKLFLNQFGIALFGIALAFSCDKAGNQKLLLATSIFSVLFYLFLQYAVMWEIGAKDGISAAAQKTGRKLWRGLLIALGGNILNVIFAFMALPGAFDAKSPISSAGKFLALMFEGMYQGILATPIGEARLHDFVWVYFAIIAPSLIVCSVAYILGSFDLHATNILIPKNADVKNNGRPE